MNILESGTVEVDERDCCGNTALFWAARLGRFEMVQYLLSVGADVNFRNYIKSTPLHMAVNDERIIFELITHGADVNASNINFDTPLLLAVQAHNEETVCMLLYHGADPNIPNNRNNTPFMLAVLTQQASIQQHLLDYVDNFNYFLISQHGQEMSILHSALISRSPLGREILDRGAEFAPEEDIFLLGRDRLDIIKVIWSKFKQFYLDTDQLNILLGELFTNEFLEVIEFIMDDSELVKTIKDVGMLADIFQINECEELYSQFVFNILSYGYSLTYKDLENIYDNFGYNDLMKLLVYIDHEPAGDRIFHVPMPHMLFNVNKSIQELIVPPNNDFVYMHGREIKIKMERSFEWFAPPQLVKVYKKFFEEEEDNVADQLPTVPSLKELAREKTRCHITKTFHLETSAQLHTFIDQLDINDMYKKILKYDIRTYWIDRKEPLFF